MSDSPTVIGQPYDGSNFGGGGGDDGGDYLRGGSRSGTTRQNRIPLTWNPFTDLGLLVLRVAVGGVFFTHGAQKALGWFEGMGLAAWGDALRAMGYTSVEVLGPASAWAEMIAGALLVLGLGTPLAAAGLLGVMINALLIRWQAGFVVDGPAAELEIVLGAAALALTLTGAGRAALESGRTWNRRPAAWGVLALIIGVGAALAVYYLLR